MAGLKPLLVAALCHTVGAGGFTGRFNGPGFVHHAEPGADVGEPLLLSDILEQRGAAAARHESAVTLPSFNHQSYSGFLKSDAKTGNQMFFWYFPTLDSTPNAPLVIWLQGGPGGSSMFGLFAENGPIELDQSLQPHIRASSWNHENSMLFIDNPVGAGFSFAGGEDGYCTNSKGCVADNLLSLLLQFSQIFPDALANGLYITGESYGGHYVPAFGARVLRYNQETPASPIPLKGVAIGDGWVDPVNMIPAYPELMRNLGLATDDEVRVIQQYCDKTVNYINQGKMVEAFNEWDMMLNGDVFPYHNYFHNITGSNNYDNLMMTNDPPEFAYYGSYLNQPEIRRAIHVGNVTFGGNSATCERHLLADFHVSLRPELQQLLADENVQVLVYSGQLDIIIGAALTERFLPYLQWDGQASFAAAEKKVWRVNENDIEVAGFVKEIPGFQRVVVRGAGHIVPFDQPERALSMIRHFIQKTSYQNLPDPVSPTGVVVV